MARFAAILLICTVGVSLANAYHTHGGVRPTTPKPVTTPVETRSMDQLYRAALAEGGKLLVYAGGDTPYQQNQTKNNFEATFPGMKVEIVVDFSKYHAPRLDYQLETNSLVADVAQLQTVQDFPRWKEEGVLMNYKPIGWDHVLPEYKDADGAFTGLFIIAFSNNVNRQLLGNNNATWPWEARDYLRPEFKNKLAVTYPNDDDAVLFWFKQVTDKYGLDYLVQFKAQNPTFVRGTAESRVRVMDGSHVATMTSGGGLVDTPGSAVVFTVPKNDPFVIWAQRAAIFKDAPHPEAAKLYMSWALALKNQRGWSVRDDAPAPPAPFKPVKDYGSNGSPQAFIDFMEDREQVEIFKNQITMIFGEVQGPSPNGILGIHPVKGYPTIDPLTAPPAP